MHAIGSRLDVAIAHPYLKKVMAAANTGHVVLEGINTETGSHERFGEAQPAALGTLPGLSAELKSHVIYDRHACLPVVIPPNCSTNADSTRASYAQNSPTSPESRTCWASRS